MLQQGKFVADIVYYYGEDNNITSLFGKKPPTIPEGYNYDYYQLLMRSLMCYHLKTVNSLRQVV
jgi:hypothetical protein